MQETEQQKERRLVLRSKIGLLREAVQSAISATEAEKGDTHRLEQCDGYLWDAAEELRE